MDMQQIMELIAKHWGYQVGAKVREEVSKVVQAENIDVDKLQSAIQTIQKLLDADPSTPEFDVGQNIITQLTDHLNRIVALENQLAILNGDEKTAGSIKQQIAQAKTEILNALNARIDELQGDVDNIKKACGLDDDGNYVPNKDANYIADATSLADADNKLDAKLKEVEDKVNAIPNAIEEAKTEAVTQAKQYVDEKTKLDVDLLASVFAQALDCGLKGASLDDVLNGKCPQNSGSGNASASGSANSSASGSANGSGSASASGSGESDGAVV